MIFLALPTPESEDGSADLSYIISVADDLGKTMTDYAVVVDKSTVPVGTAARVRAVIAKNSKTAFDVVSNPEFLREGSAIKDFLDPDRVVIGTSSKRAEEIMRRLYSPLLRTNNPLLVMSEESAEMTKYVANALLASRISFMNEAANLCELLGADINDVRVGVGADYRIGQHFLFPGPGYGGSCFPKDTAALLNMAESVGSDFSMVRSTMKVNKSQQLVIPKKVLSYFEGNVKGKTFAMWGLAFKAKTDDVRESPARAMIAELTKKGATIVAYDPVAIPSTKRIDGENDRLRFSDKLYDALEGADALIIATEWGEFRTPDFKQIKQKLNQPVIFDGRNLYEDAMLRDIKKLGFHYESIGRPTIN